jgi:hypothetical protein
MASAERHAALGVESVGEVLRRCHEALQECRLARRAGGLRLRREDEQLIARYYSSDLATRDEKHALPEEPRADHQLVGALEPRAEAHSGDDAQPASFRLDTKALAVAQPVVLVEGDFALELDRAAR